MKESIATGLCEWRHLWGSLQADEPQAQIERFAS